MRFMMRADGLSDNPTVLCLSQIQCISISQAIDVSYSNWAFFRSVSDATATSMMLYIS